MLTSLQPTRLSALAPALLLLANPASAQETAVAAPALVSVGASVTAGFRLADYEGMFSNLREGAERILGRELTDEEYGRRTDGLRPGDVLAELYGFEVPTFGDTMLFSNPLTKGRAVLEAGLATGADTVLGVDLVFWFGYGRTDENAAEERLTLQATGLAMVDELLAAHPDTTLVIGDYPDMTGALPAMITPDMIPTKEEQAELNRRLAEWAERRPKVHVFPLSASLQRLRDGEAAFEVDGEVQPVSLDAAFQLALVHPTRLGTAVLVRDLVAFLGSRVDEEFGPRAEGDAQYLAAAGA